MSLLCVVRAMERVPRLCARRFLRRASAKRRGGVERAWDCVYMQNNRKARHTDNPEETFETGNETTTKLTIS